MQTSTSGLYEHLIKEGPSWKTFGKPSGSHTVTLCLCINNYDWPASCFSNQVRAGNCVYASICAWVYYRKGRVKILYYTNNYLLLLTAKSIIKDVLKNLGCSHCLPCLDLLNKKKGIYSRKQVSCASWRKKEHNVGLEILSVGLWLVPVRMRGRSWNGMGGNKMVMKDKNDLSCWTDSVVQEKYFVCSSTQFTDCCQI